MQKLGLISLEKRRLHNDLCMVFKMLHGNLDVNVREFFCMKDSVTRGHSLTLVKQRCKKDIRLHFFSNRIVNLWNCLPEKVVKAPSISSFKELLCTTAVDQIIEDLRKRFLRGEASKSQ